MMNDESDNVLLMMFLMIDDDHLTAKHLFFQGLPLRRQMVTERFRPVKSTGRRALQGDEHGGDETPFRPQDFVGACWRVPSKDSHVLYDLGKNLDRKPVSKSWVLTISQFLSLFSQVYHC